MAPAGGGSGDAETAHQRVLWAIEGRIINGSLRAGDRLPGERELAEMLGVSRNSVREALRVLDSMGVVAREAGRGAGAGCTVTTGPSDALGRLLRLQLALSQFTVEDLVDVRVQLEVQAVRESSRRGLGRHSARVAGLVAAMGTGGLSPLEFYSLDTQFHIAVSKSSGNPLLVALMQALRDVVQREMVAAREQVADWPPVARQLRDEHAAIMEAVQAGDAVEASALVERHIRGFYRHRK